MPEPKRTPTGTWQVRWRDDGGQQRARTFKRKEDARRFLNDTLSDLQRGRYVGVDAGTLKVTEWADVWLAGARQLGAGGRETYRRDLDRYILPELGGLQLRRLTDKAIDEYLTAMLDRGLAPSSVHRHYRTIRRMCQVAVDRRKLAREAA